MTIKIILITTLSTIIGLTGCSNTPKPIKYNIDKEKNIASIERSFKLYSKYNTHKAMAIAMDKEGKYVIGYSYSCASEENAKNIALNNCSNANDNAEVKADASCVIYAVENQIVHTLQ